MKTRYILQEERGVAMFPYKDAIDDIFKYISDYVMEQVDINRENEELYRYGKINRYEYNRNVKPNINFYIPDYLIKPFDFVSDLEIIVYAKQDRNTGNDINAGKFSYYGDACIDSDGRLDCGIITLKCKYDYRDGSLYEKSIYNTLYHEFNHMYLLWQQLKTSKLEDTGKFKIRGQLYNKDDNKFNSEFKNEYFENLMYRLFNFDESNALIASVYGDLKQIYSQYNSRPKFQDAVKQTQAYEEYKYFYKYMDTFVDSLNDNEVSFIKSYFKEKKVFIKMYSNSFKLSLKLKIRNELKNLFHRICKAASLYYDEMDDLKEHNRRIIDF